jgi:2-alkyl-3-oxoalkanoate reductase
MIVLVTGATGFLGQRVVRRLLSDGHQLRALVRPGRQIELPAAVEVAEGDLRSADDIERVLRGVEAAVHCGARVQTTGARGEFEETNVEATRRIIAAAADRPVVHVSSLSVYDVPRDGVVISEDSPYESGAGDRGFYSQTKLAADRVAMEAAAAGAPVIVVRPGVLYGPGRRPPLARQSFAFRSLRLILGKPGYLLPLAHGDNVADAIALALTQPRARGRAYTLVDPQIPLGDYLSLYRSVAKARWKPVFVPTVPLLPAVGVAAALFGVIGRRSPVTRHQIQRATWSARYDCSRARAELGWFSRVSLYEGLCQTVAPPPRAAVTATPALVSQ